ncbi:hypothetical protein M885DRAFT_519299 [Pelagophyceae sp. CCMP2097]|nr:hypothetical protein M885DRAFT_519299 [Pelagophyceae sp. CCMP2097]
MEFIESEGACRELLDSFRALLESAVSDEADEGTLDSRKRLKRARILHDVLVAKHPATKPEQFKTMAIEGVQGLLEASYPVEKKASSLGFPDAAELVRHLALLDAIGKWVTSLTCTLGSALIVDQRSSSAQEAASEVEVVQSADEAQKLLAALALSGTSLQDALSPDEAPVTDVAATREAVILGLDLWESLHWRRGSLRYYACVTRFKHGAVDLEVAAQGAEALWHFLSVRTPPDSPKKPPPSALAYGVYSTTHLLALAYAAELAAWRAAGDDGAGWAHKALVSAHRYLYTVGVLMEGCGWGCDKPVELVTKLGGLDALRGALALEWADEKEAVAPEIQRLEPLFKAPVAVLKKTAKGKKKK